MESGTEVYKIKETFIKLFDDIGIEGDWNVAGIEMSKPYADFAGVVYGMDKIDNNNVPFLHAVGLSLVIEPTNLAFSWASHLPFEITGLKLSTLTMVINAVNDARPGMCRFVKKSDIGNSMIIQTLQVPRLTKDWANIEIDLLSNVIRQSIWEFCEFCIYAYQQCFEEKDFDIHIEK